MNKVTAPLRKESAAPAARPDDDIDFSAILAAMERNWRDAVRAHVDRPAKQQLTVRIDADVLEWLRSEGKGYQSRLNAILRAAMLDQTRSR